jgi:hypothetical protein
MPQTIHTQATSTMKLVHARKKPRPKARGKRLDKKNIKKKSGKK